MSFLRPALILLAFFGILYYFQEPLKRAAPSFASLHSAYAEPFKRLFHDITTATSSTVLGSGINYVPAPAGSATTSYAPEGTEISPTKANSTEATSHATTVTTAVDSQGNLLPVTSNQQEAGLSIQGIVAYTNVERSKQGLPALKVNQQLTSSAESKLQDMFKNQYFEHVSPSGESVSDVVRKIGYEYIVVGENLALGVFSGDSQVVAAWMASPGHKKNILDSRYQDIGVAVGQGVYQGKRQWLIVQHFGKPLSSCSTPAASLKQNIEAEKNDVSASEAKIAVLKAAVDKSTGDEYRAKAAEYNAAVTDYNAKLAELKKDVDSYNDKVRAYNVCAGILGA